MKLLPKNTKGISCAMVPLGGRGDELSMMDFLQSDWLVLFCLLGTIIGGIVNIFLNKK